MQLNHRLKYIILTVTLLTGIPLLNITGLAKGQIYPQWECDITGRIVEEDPLEVDPGFSPDPFRFQKEFQQRSLDYRNGCEIGTVLGSAQGVSEGYNDRVAGREANPGNNYVNLSETEVCILFEDFYETKCVLPGNSSQMIPYGGNNSNAVNFMQGYLDAYPLGYNAGYFVGYYLDRVIDQRYLIDELGSVNRETVEPAVVESRGDNINTDGGNDSSIMNNSTTTPVR